MKKSCIPKMYKRTIRSKSIKIFIFFNFLVLKKNLSLFRKPKKSKLEPKGQNQEQNTLPRNAVIIKTNTEGKNILG